ncbi:hypothetical protein QQX98_004289 [Neonectria punicea]|uniref:Rhodopsin domain-containing protein n=1 Tax=Neonectria punicea TaxID=979145 RepID=A0ABR1H9W7_9HYPO
MDKFPVVDGVTVFMAAPDGYEVDFDHPKRRLELEAYIVCGVGLVLALFFFVQFLYVKVWVLRRLDGEAGSFANALMGVHVWELSLKNFNYGSKFMVMTPILYAIETGFAKISLVLFYNKLSPQKWWKWSVYGTFFLIVGYNVAIFFAVIFGCRPLKKHWTAEMTKGSCINRPAIYIATAALGILSDLVLLVLPIPMIVRLQMPPRQKAGLILLFTVGSATLVTSVVRMVLLMPILHHSDVTWVIASAVIWIFVESNLLIICASLTTLRRFFIHVAPRLIGERGSSAGYHLRGTTGGYRHPFKTIGSVVQRKRMDKFGMTVNKGAGFDLGVIGHALPTKTAIGRGGERPERVIARHLRRQESINKFADSGSEVQILDQPGTEDVDVERAIVQTTTVTVVYEDRTKRQR